MQRQLWCLYWTQHHGHHRQVTEYRRPRGTAVATRIPRRPTPPAHARSPQSRDLGPSRSLGQSPAATIRPATRSPHAARHAVAGREGGGRSRRSADRRPAQLRGGAAPYSNVRTVPALLEQFSSRAKASTTGRGVGCDVRRGPLTPPTRWRRSGPMTGAVASA